MKKGFSKRIFTPWQFIRDLGYLSGHLPGIIRILYSKHKPKQLYEKIFMVTDAVNGCIYCSWLDAKLAVKSGMSEEEIQSVLKLEFQTAASAYELNALLYAQHYAETNRHPDPNMTAKLFATYGEKIANDILLAIRAVTFGNLYFNTWRAVISRFRGEPAPGSNIIFEIVYFLINFMIIMPFVILRRFDRRVNPVHD